jgi:hypothetical protein
MQNTPFNTISNRPNNLTEQEPGQGLIQAFLLMNEVKKVNARRWALHDKEETLGQRKPIQKSNHPRNTGTTGQHTKEAEGKIQ